MKPLLVAAGVCALALPAMAQKRVDLFFDVEGVRRTGMTSGFTPGITRFEPQFQSGGGAGAGVNWFLSDRVSLETKVAGLGTKARLRVIGSDFVGTADLGWAQIYPISAVIQWHFLEHGFVRPYVGAGAVHTIMKNINRKLGAGATGIHFKDPTGAVVDAGLEFSLGKRWNLVADGRYVPIETKTRTTFLGTTSTVNLSVRPAIVSFGLGYRF